MFHLIRVEQSFIGIIVPLIIAPGPIKDCLYKGEHPKFGASKGLGFQGLKLEVWGRVVAETSTSPRRSISRQGGGTYKGILQQPSTLNGFRV